MSALAKFLSFYVKVFYVMGKALTGELSCPVTGLVTTVIAAMATNSSGSHLALWGQTPVESPPLMGTVFSSWDCLYCPIYFDYYSKAHATHCLS